MKSCTREAKCITVVGLNAYQGVLSPEVTYIWRLSRFPIALRARMRRHETTISRFRVIGTDGSSHSGFNIAGASVHTRRCRGITHRHVTRCREKARTHAEVATTDGTQYSASLRRNSAWSCTRSTPYSKARASAAKSLRRDIPLSRARHFLTLARMSALAPSILGRDESTLRKSMMRRFRRQ